jgi:nitroimidazol reductase NimA-like FMN-containing flavoprotein (pyridoxamine 5'-phosphate oxidase superfamily)
MSTEQNHPRAQVEELAESECLDLLGTKRVGRVAHNDPDGPVVVPVNYVLQDGMVLFRISPYSRLADRLRDGSASFQVDHVDEDARTGWSVLVRGHAARAKGWELPESDERPTPWAEGNRNLHVRLSPHHISGVRLIGR